MMAAIADRTERELPYAHWLTERGVKANDQSATIAFGAVGAVYQLGLKALVVPTKTGRTAALISSHRPNVPVLALSQRAEVVRRCSFLWGVRAELMEEPMDAMDLIYACADAAVRRGLAQKGDRIGITAGLPSGVSGGTNLFKVHEIT
jgi:pyruvate kinase